MRTKQALLAVATALTLLGSASVALASDHEPTDSYGGAKVGPLGQVFSSGPVQQGWNAHGWNGYGWNGYGPNAYDQAPAKHTVHKHTVRPSR